MRYYGVAAGIPIVVRAMAHNDFIKLCSVLDVVDKNDLKEKFEAACAYMNNRNTNTGKDRCEIYRSMVKFDMLDIR